MKKIFKITFILVFSAILSGCSFASQQNTLISESSQPSLQQQNINQTMPKETQEITKLNQDNMPNNINTQQNPIEIAENDEEETAVINVSNFGRNNPFSPFQEKSLILGKSLLSDIPEPPVLNNVDPDVSSLLDVKISGILYDSKKPLAIINVENEDYFVHKGETIFGFYIQDIKPSKVTVKKGNNTYRASIGEIIEEDKNSNNQGNSAEKVGQPLTSPQSLNSLPEMNTPNY
ncbi:MAG: hypothetical protein V2B14_03250 [bacterium]